MSGNLPIRVFNSGDSDTIRVLGETNHFPNLPASPFRFPLGHQAWGEPASSQVQVSLRPAVYRYVMGHAQTGAQGGRRFEVGGVLLGQAYLSADGQAYHVDVVQALADDLGVRGVASFEFTYESWAALVMQAETRYPDLRIIGWYHSHPDYGAFFSGTDRKTQRTYFVTPWRVGLVVDPIRQEAKFFAASGHSEDVVELPGFFERLDPGQSSVVTWRNWSQHPTAKANPRSSMVYMPPRTALRSRRSARWLAIMWAVGVSAALMLTQCELNQVQSELHLVQATINAWNAGGTKAPQSTPPLIMPEDFPSPTLAGPSYLRPPEKFH